MKSNKSSAFTIKKYFTNYRDRVKILTWYICDIQNWSLPELATYILIGTHAEHQALHRPTLIFT